MVDSNIMLQKVDFYVLQNLNLTGKYTYACRIVQKAYRQGLQTTLFVQDESLGLKLDQLLWTFSQGSFIPHKMMQTGDDWQAWPVQICYGNLPSADHNKDLHLLVLLSDELPGGYQLFTRLIDMVCQQPEDKALGRRRFKAYRETMVELQTHQIS